MAPRNRRNPSEKVYDLIRAKILKGELSAGSRINIRSLCEEFGTSRIPIRDVLNRLCGEELVLSFEKGGYSVVTLTETDIRETYDLRGTLEAYLVKKAASNFGKEDVEHLEENLRHQEKEKDSDLEQYIHLNKEFHEAFFKAANNSKFVKAVKKLRDYQDRFDRINWTSHGNFFTNLTFQQHKEILRAVKKGDGELAERMAKMHMNTGAEFLIKALREKKIL